MPAQQPSAGGHRWVHTSRRPSDDRGQSSAEFLGMIVVATAVIGVLVMGAFGSQIDAGIKAAICRILGGNCTAETTAVDHRPTSPCETVNATGELSADITVFSVDVGGSAKLTLSRAVGNDGVEHWFVTQQGEGRLGAHGLVGESANVGDVGEGVKAKLKGFLKAGAGEKLDFKSKKDAEDYINYLAHETAKKAMTSPDPTGLGKKFLDWVDQPKYNPPRSTEYFFEGGQKIEGSVEGKAGVAGLTGSLNESGVVGVSIKPNPDGTSNKTYYVKLSAEAAGKLGLFEVAQGKVSESGEVVVGITYNGKGQPDSASLEVTGNLTAQGSLTLPLLGDKKSGSLTNLPAIGKNVTAKARLNLDLKNRGNADALADALHSVGIPLLNNEGSAQRPDPITAAKNLGSRYTSGAAGATIALTTYDGTSSSEGASVEAGEGVAFGVEGALKFDGRHITNGYYFDPDKGFVPWEACTK